MKSSRNTLFYRYLVKYLLILGMLTGACSQVMGMEGESQATKDLFQAVYTGNVAAAENAARQGASINATDESGLTPLEVAARHGTLTDDLFRVLVSWGALLHRGPEDQRTLLMIAVHWNHLRVVNLLLRYGLDRYDPQGDALLYALKEAYQEKSDQKKVDPEREAIINTLVLQMGQISPLNQNVLALIAQEFPEYRNLFTEKAEEVEKRIIDTFVKLEATGSRLESLTQAGLPLCRTKSVAFLSEVLPIAIKRGLFSKGLLNIIKSMGSCFTAKDLSLLLIEASKIKDPTFVKAILDVLKVMETPPDLLAEALRTAAVRGYKDTVDLYLRRYGADFIGSGMLRTSAEEAALIGHLATAQLILEVSEGLIKKYPGLWSSYLTRIAQHAAIRGDLDHLSLFRFVLGTGHVNLAEVARFISMALLDPSFTPERRKALIDALEEVGKRLSSTGATEKEYQNILGPLAASAREQLRAYLHFPTT
jgi:hypothetical protein